MVNGFIPLCDRRYYTCSIFCDNILTKNSETELAIHI